MPLSDYLDMECLARLPRLELQAKYLVDGFRNGIHSSPFQGADVEFKDYRKYEHGDEIRMIDWKAYARTDRPHVRLREDDSNLNANLFLDISASMDFQGPLARMNKFAFAKAAAAALLLFLKRQGDAFSLTFLGETLSETPNPSATELHFQRMLSALARPAGDSACRWEILPERIASDLRPRGIAVLISDFYVAPSELLPVLDALNRKKCEVLLFHVFDPAERELPDSDSLLLEEAETGTKMTVSPELIRSEYSALFRKHCSELAELAGTFGGEYLELCTNRPPLDLFGAYWRMRTAGRKRK